MKLVRKRPSGSVGSPDTADRGEAGAKEAGKAAEAMDHSKDEVSSKESGTDVKGAVTASIENTAASLDRFEDDEFELAGGGGQDSDGNDGGANPGVEVQHESRDGEEVGGKEDGSKEVGDKEDGQASESGESPEGEDDGSDGDNDEGPPVCRISFTAKGEDGVNIVMFYHSKFTDVEGARKAIREAILEAQRHAYSPEYFMSNGDVLPELRLIATRAMVPDDFWVFIRNEAFRAGFKIQVIEDQH